MNTKKFEERHNNETTPSNRNTFKTLSEPSWNEKHKIFQRQKLQENLNDLMEQFMFLESDDLGWIAKFNIDLGYMNMNHARNAKNSITRSIESLLSFVYKTYFLLQEEIVRYYGLH